MLVTYSPCSKCNCGCSYNSNCWIISKCRCEQCKCKEYSRLLSKQKIKEMRLIDSYLEKKYAKT